DDLSFVFLANAGPPPSSYKSTFEDHLCIVAPTSSERGTQFYPLASYTSSSEPHFCSSSSTFRCTAQAAVRPNAMRQPCRETQVDKAPR
ncbi:unnamed protein product, partial [Ascophyllum nodosum]